MLKRKGSFKSFNALWFYHYHYSLHITLQRSYLDKNKSCLSHRQNPEPNAKVAHHDAPFVPNVIPRRNIPRLPTSCFSASHCCNSTVQTRRAGLAGHENENLSQLSHRTLRFFPCRRSNISFPKSFSLGARCCCRRRTRRDRKTPALAIAVVDVVFAARKALVSKISLLPMFGTNICPARHSP